MHQAHKLLLGQASLIRSVFPVGLEMLDFQEKARQRSNTAGAPDVLNFLRNHAAKLAAELSGQPGAPVVAVPSSSPDKKSRGAATTGSAPDDSTASSKISSTGQLQDSVANLVSDPARHLQFSCGSLVSVL